jgi:hypothetical protein
VVSLSYSGDSDKKTTAGGLDYYHGDVTFTISTSDDHLYSGDGVKMHLHCLYHGLSHGNELMTV